MSALVDFILHSDRHLLEFVGAYGVWVYALLFLIVFAETGFVVTPFLPGDSLLFATGALCATGALRHPWRLALLAFAAFAGNAVNYTVGRWSGRKSSMPRDGPAGLHRLLNRDHLKRAHAFFEQYGGKAVILGRFVPIVRTFVPFVAGAAQMTSHVVRVLQRRRRGRLGGAVPGRGPALRQRADRQGELLARDDRHRRGLAAAGGGGVSPHSGPGG